MSTDTASTASVTYPLTPQDMTRLIKKLDYIEDVVAENYEI